MIDFIEFTANKAKSNFYRDTSSIFRKTKLVFQNFRLQHVWIFLDNAAPHKMCEHFSIFCPINWPKRAPLLRSLNLLLSAVYEKLWKRCFQKGSSTTPRVKKYESVADGLKLIPLFYQDWFLSKKKAKLTPNRMVLICVESFFVRFFHEIIFRPLACTRITVNAPKNKPGRDNKKRTIGEGCKNGAENAV